jgi:hypothetical protein
MKPCKIQALGRLAGKITATSRPTHAVHANISRSKRAGRGGPANQNSTAMPSAATERRSARSPPNGQCSPKNKKSG